MDYLTAYLWPILGALGAGGLIGFEREFRGRAAGFRTHILVCLASCVLMLAAARQSEWNYVVLPGANLVSDPTRMAHGILTGIGFLCGGVIFREGFSIHGLTSAASLWMTSAVGVLFGVELYPLAISAAVSTLAVLALFRIVEQSISRQIGVDMTLRYGRADAMHEDDIRELLRRFGFRLKRIGWSVTKEQQTHHLKVVGKTPLRTEALVAELNRTPAIAEFSITPRDD
ncbi:MAG: MgtC/SapB family protein [Caulobacteraceae bacterium]|nr:MgtC/SapB family protein [Caulobacteraceae bacterium]